MSENSLKIYQTFHKSFPHRKNSWITPIGVNGHQEEGFISDSAGDNIAHLNPYYCELTAQYWAWKNCTSQKVGFYHYRRYLNPTLDNTWKGERLFSVPLNENILDYLTSDTQKNSLEYLLDIFDIIIPAQININIKEQDQRCTNVSNHYKTYHVAAHWDAFTNTLEQNFPSNKNLVRYFDISNQVTAYNMFATRRDIFDSYCKDLFNTLDPLFAEFGKDYNEYNRRYIGFLAERFLWFWIKKEKLNYVEVPMLMLTE